MTTEARLTQLGEEMAERCLVEALLEANEDFRGQIERLRARNAKLEKVVKAAKAYYDHGDVDGWCEITMENALAELEGE